MYWRFEARPHNFGQVIELRILTGDTEESLRGVGILQLNPLTWMQFRKILQLYIKYGWCYFRRTELLRVAVMDGTERKPAQN